MWTCIISRHACWDCNIVIPNITCRIDDLGLGCPHKERTCIRLHYLIAALAAILLAPNAWAVCDLESLNFYTVNGILQPVPRTSGCNMQRSVAAGASTSLTIPTGANYMKASYVGDARVVLDSAKNKFGSSAPVGDIDDGTAWPLKPTFVYLQAVSSSVITTVKITGVTATSTTLEFYK